MSRTHPCLRALPALTLLLTTAPLPAQTVLLELAPEGPFGAIGEQVAAAGDVDLDGVTDLLVAGRVGTFTFSGATGAELAFHDVGTSIDSQAPRNLLGLPDVDGDGQLDLAVASREELRVYSRGDGALLWLFSTPDLGGVAYNLALVRDLDADGLDDLAVSEQYASPNGVTRAGSIHLLSSATGATLNRIDGQAGFQEIGGSLAVLGDLDGDGVDELAFDDKDYLVGGENFGRVVIVGAADGHVLRTIVSPLPTFNFPFSLAPAGDVDGDGTPDLSLGWFLNGSPSVWHLSAYSGADGALLWDQTGFTPRGLTNVGDVDGDGVDEVISGTPGSFIGGASARLWDGADGGTLLSLSGAQPEFDDFAAVGDLDGDGGPDLLSGGSGGGLGGLEPFARAISLADASTLQVCFNPAGGEGLGRAFDRGPDRDGDGVADWNLLGVQQTLHLSGADGSLLAELPLPYAPATLFNAPTAILGVPDLDADGLPEHVVGDGSYGAFAPLAFDGRLMLLSGADGALLVDRPGAMGEQFANRLARAHDEDGDGVADLYVTAAGRDAGGADAGAVELVSGATLASLRTLSGALQEGGRFGQSVSSGADVDLDGVVDVAVGSDEEGPGQFDSGSLYLFSGADGAQLLRVDGALGSVTTTGALMGDADADGVPDLIVSEAGFKAPGESTKRGRVRLLSGATGALLWTRQGDTDSEQFGTRAEGAGDVDGDGLADVVVVCYPVGAGLSVRVLSGADGALLDAFDPDPEHTNNSISQVGLGGLLDAGGCSEFAVGIPTLDDNGGVRVYASSQGGDWGFIDLGHGLAGSQTVPPHLGIWGDLQGGGSKSLAVLRALPNTLAAWFLSVGAANVPFKGGVLVPSPFVGFFVGIVSTDANGEIVVLDTPTPLGIPQGVSVWHQFAFQDPLAPVGVALSNALREIFKGD